MNNLHKFTMILSRDSALGSAWLQLNGCWHMHESEWHVLARIWCPFALTCLEYQDWHLAKFSDLITFKSHYHTVHSEWAQTISYYFNIFFSGKEH